MTLSFPSKLRRLGAGLLVLLLLAAQMALPMAAVAQADLTSMPTLELTYQTSGEGGTLTMQVFPALNGQQPVYWAQLAPEAFQFPVLLHIYPAAMSPYVYTPENGTPLQAMDAMDFAGMSIPITALQDGNPVASYPLYLSSIPMPQMQPAMVPVSYVDDQGNPPFFSTTVPCYSGQPNVIAMDGTLVPEGYTLTSQGSVEVWVDAFGAASPTEVIFTFAAPQQPVTATVTVYYLGLNGMELAGAQTKTLSPGTHDITPDFVPEGYALNSPSPVQVTVDEAGGVSPSNEVVFEFKEKEVEQNQGDPPGGETEQDPPAGETDPSDVEWTPIGLYGQTNKNKVNFRTQPIAGTHLAASEVPEGTYLWVQGSGTVAGINWYKITYNGTDCYVMSEHVAVLSQEDSDRHNYSQPSPVPGTETQRPSNVQVLVSYVDADDPAHVLYNENVTCALGSRTDVVADPSKISGYHLVGDDMVTVDVDANGAASPSTVTFAFQKTAVKGYYTIAYVDGEGQPVASSQQVEQAPGTYDVVPSPTDLQQGYVLAEGTPASQQVTIDAQGNASLATVSFIYTKPTVKGSYTIAYVDGNQQQVASSQQVEQGPGTYDVVPNPTDLQAGYVLAEGTPASQQVTIDAQGNASLATVAFIYRKPAVQAQITVEYKDTLGAKIADAQQVTVNEGENNITPDMARVPKGYVLAGESSFPVTVDPSGVAAPGSVAFTFQIPVNETKITVFYKDDIGGDVIPAQTVTLQKGNHPITPNAALVPTGYTLNPSSPTSVEVKVDDQLVATPATVTFLYDKPAQSATVTVLYVDTAGKEIALAEQRVLAEGSHNLAPDENRIPANYALAEGSTPTQPVNVTRQGVATPTSVTFRYQQVAADMYIGYAVTLSQTTLRDNANNDDTSIIATLPKDTLLYLNGQATVGTTVWSGAQTVLGADKKIGILVDSATKHITKEEADAIIKKYNDAHPTPSPTPTAAPTRVPDQLTGYYITIGDNVYLRNMTSVMAQANLVMSKNTVVYVGGQLYNEGYGWHITTYGQYSGYVRADQMRKLSDVEVQAYLKTLSTPTPTPAATAAPYDPNAKSSYGYITKDGVNFRMTPNGSKIKTLNKYAFMLVYGTKEVNGVTWYNVNQSGTVGWIHGDYMHQMSITELSGFLNSNEYLQGLRNSGGTNSNTNTNTGTNNSTGKATQGNISSVEDWNVGTWKNTGVNTGLSASYEPFDPYSTPVPSASAGPNASASVEPVATFVIGTMIPITYDDESKETQTDSTPWGFIGAGVVLVGGAGGVYAYALNQNKKRKAAAKAAAAGRRAGQPGNPMGPGGKPGQAPQSPYARRAVAAPPMAGSQQRGQEPQASGGMPPYGRPMGTPPQSGAMQPPSNQSVFGAPMGGGTSSQNPYARPVGQPADPSGRPQGSTGNPYVQPIEAGSTGDGQQGRRVSRTQRYQNAEGNEDQDR